MLGGRDVAMLVAALVIVPLLCAVYLRSGGAELNLGTPMPSSPDNDQTSLTGKIRAILLERGAQASFLGSSVTLFGRLWGGRAISVTSHREFIVAMLKEAVTGSNVTKEFVYITQTESCLPPHLAPLRSNRSDVVVLSWRQPCREQPHHFFAPDTTWSMGRNMALLYALVLERRQGWRYKYYILLDDDASLRFVNATAAATAAPDAPYRAFEDFLLRFQPAVGYPIFGQFYTRGDFRTRFPNNSTDYAEVAWFDALFNAYHRDVLLYVLPYDTSGDRDCWYVSQARAILDAAVPYKGYLLMTRAIAAQNPQHRPYPRCSSRRLSYVREVAFSALYAELAPMVPDPPDITWPSIFYNWRWGEYDPRYAGKFERFRSVKEWANLTRSG